MTQKLELIANLERINTALAYHIQANDKTLDTLKGRLTLIDFSALSTRATNCLVSRSVIFWEEWDDLTTYGAPKWRNVGKVTLQEIEMENKKAKK